MLNGRKLHAELPKQRYPGGERVTFRDEVIRSRDAQRKNEMKRRADARNTAEDGSLRIGDRVLMRQLK